MAEIEPGSRFAGLSQARAALVIMFVLLALVASVRPTGTAYTKPPAASARQAARDGDDLALYRAIEARVATGQGYYPAAASELRTGDYPLRPFITFRLPALAVVGALLGSTSMRALLWFLMAATLAVWWRRLEGAFAVPARRGSAVMLLASGMLIGARPEYLVVHEVWAGLLIALALGLHRPSRWWPSVIIAALALAVRELALPFVLLMSAAALIERRWREAAAWAGLVIAFSAAMALHAQQVSLVILSSDPASPGWASLGGWSAFVRTMAETTALRVFPAGFAAGLVIAALFGWMSRKGRIGAIATLMFVGYGALFMMLGRANNFYWGLLVAPCFLMGIAFLPQAMRDLWGAIANEFGHLQGD